MIIIMVIFLIMKILHTVNDPNDVQKAFYPRKSRIFYTIKHNYIDASVQKMYEPKLSACVEHVFCLLEITNNDAISNRIYIWYNAAQLVLFALKHYYFPDFIKIILIIYIKLK